MGDFSGSGVGVMLWNPTLQNGQFYSLQGSSLNLVGQVQPSNKTEVWNVAGIGDMDDNGVSDVLLRDSKGDLEILYMGPTGLMKATDLTPSQLIYNATSYFSTTYPALAKTGKFDSSWTVVAVGKFNDYAAIIWTSSLGELGLTQFIYPAETPDSSVFAVLPTGEQIQGLGDFNGDGSVDLLLTDSTTGLAAIWYLNYFGGKYFQPAPATTLSVTSPWQF